MSRISNIQEVVRHRLCISCGVCASAVAAGAIEMRYDRRYAIFVPAITRPDLVSGAGAEYEVCPGKGCEIIRLSRKVSRDEAPYDLDLGFIRNIWAVQASDPTILRDASSGGAMTALAAYLLSSGRVQGVIASRFSYGPQGPLPQTIIAQSLDDLLTCQGSKYCPVSAGQILLQLGAFDGNVAFVGTPCQIEGLRMLQERSPIIASKVRYAIGNFCGGMRDFREMQAIITRQGFDPAQVVRFRYRGDGQPGSMRIEDTAGRIKYRPYPDYGTDAGYQKLERCRLCIDGTAELADFACGDAWLPRFRTTGSPWSLVIARNSAAAAIVQEMIAQKLITVGDVSPAEVKQSQKTNLTSKKNRQASRRQLHQLLGRSLPSYDGGYPEGKSGLLLEAKVYVTHCLVEMLENMHVYVPFIKLVRHIRRSNTSARASKSA